jgi:hypothetical protein
MKKTFRVFLLILLGFLLVQLMWSSNGTPSKDPATSAVSAYGATTPPVYSIDAEKEGTCEKANVIYLSLPAKCLTKDGLKVAVEQPPKIIPIWDIK